MSPFSPSPSRPPWRCPLPGLVRRGALVLAALLACPPAGAGQAADARPSEGVVERELEYRSARSDHQAAMDAWNVVENRFSEALDEVARARRSGDGDRQEAALAAAQAISLELHRADQRVADEEEELEEAREALLAALDARRARLEDELLDAETPAEQRRVDALIRDLENQYRQVEASSPGGGLDTELVYFPSITFDPRDGPLELAAKAELLERKARAADTTIASVDRQVERLEALLGFRRARENFQRNLDRFDDTRVPVGPPARGPEREGDRAVATDSAGVALSPEAIERRLESLRLFRRQAELAREQFLRRARLFRERLGTVTG